MLKEAVDELFGLEGAAAPFAGIGVTIAKSDGVLVELEDAIVAESHPEDVRGQVLQSAQAIPDWFTMDHPLLLPHFGRDVCIARLGKESVLNFGTKDSGESSHRNQEVLVSREPGFSVRGQSPCWDEAVDVRVISQVAPPGMQDAQHADLASHEAWISSQFLGGCCGSLEEHIVDQALMAASDFIETRRNRESQEEVGHRQQHVLLLLQPLLAILVLAFGAAAVATGVIAVAHLLALRTDVDLPSQSRCPTAFNGPHRLEMGSGYAPRILLAIGLSVAAENVRQL